MRVMRWEIRILCILAWCLSSPWIMQAQSLRAPTAERSRLAQEVEYRLVMLPNYTIFDNLQFELPAADTVTIQGQVVRPSLKSEAERVIRALEGVGVLVNKIEVLPIALEDEKTRTAVYSAIFSRPELQRYFIRAVLPIHIIVKNGSITLLGTVETQMDKERVGNAAKDVPGALGVTNKLKVERAIIQPGD
jgi:hyperosmotically inducible protein